MKLLVIGSGGREHALAWKLAQSNKVEIVYVAPGNAGTASEKKICNITLSDHQHLIQFCIEQEIAFTLIGPEAPLAAGIVDDFISAGLAVFGPSQYCAQLESSKDFAKAFMRQHGIPTAAYATFTDAEAAHRYIDEKGAPIVIKADGLAAGKGVVVAMTAEDAHNAIDSMLLDNSLGSAGARVVIEDYLQGEEASFIVMVDGEHVLPMASSQDHKRLLDDDAGPNTGGMGAYSPAPIVTPEVHQRVMDEIILPAVKGMQEAGHPYRGFLYAGLMIDESGAPYTIEFNCRFGDPETQPIMCRLQTDLVDLLLAALEGKLDKISVNWSDQTAVGVVLAAAGYPQTPKRGDFIEGIEAANQIGKVFHAGTTFNLDKKLMVSGGRVLCVVGMGNNVAEAQKQAYAAITPIQFRGMHYRKDIAAKALK